MAFFDCWEAKRHVVAPFAIPPDWLRFRSMDWGSASPFSVGWWESVTVCRGKTSLSLNRHRIGRPLPLLSPHGRYLRARSLNTSARPPGGGAEEGILDVMVIGGDRIQFVP